MKQFKDKEVLITGAGSGIGRATALAFAARRCEAVVVGYQCDGNEQTAALARQRGAVVRTLHCNVADAASVQAMADTVHGEIEALDILMNNAGIGSAGRFLDTTLDTWRRVMDINLMGVVLRLPRLPAEDGGARAGWPCDQHCLCRGVHRCPGYADLRGQQVCRARLYRGVARRYGEAQHRCDGDLPWDHQHADCRQLDHGREHEQRRAPCEGGEVLSEAQLHSRSRWQTVVLEAVRKNVAVQPVSPEAWGMYLAKRLMRQGWSSKLSERELPF
jgi:hypothetical protein